jgi:hypothetical protein
MRFVREFMAKIGSEKLKEIDGGQVHGGEAVEREIKY